MEEKIQIIRDYLKKQFPSADHADQNDFDRMGHKFRITTNDHVMLTSVSREFIEDNNSKVIITILDRINLRNLLNDNPKSTIIVTSSGTRIETRNCIF